MSDKRRPFQKPSPERPKLTWGSVTEQARIIRDLQELGGVVIDTRPATGFTPPRELNPTDAPGGYACATDK